MDLALAGSLVAAAYLIGAVPFGWLIARAKGVDIFSQGSGNIGATNVGRILGRRLGVVVFLLDFAKGAGPVAAAAFVEQRMSAPPWRDGWLAVAAGLAAFLGHCFPIYLRFRGGKGVATGVGVVAMLMIGQPLPLLAAILAFLVVVGTTRYMSLASIVAAGVLAGAQLALARGDWRQPLAAFCLLATALVTLRHRSNLIRLWHGRESRLQESRLMSQLPKSLHVMALGLWFGMSVFFTFVVALSLFDTFERLGKESAKNRPEWFPVAASYRYADAHVNGPKEQGTRAAGAAVGPMFAWYFVIQGICGLIALATALPWYRHGKVHRWRVGLLLFGVLGVLAGWPIEQIVLDHRPERDAATLHYLQTATGALPPDLGALRRMKDARGIFGRWHMASLFLNLGTIVAVTAAMALASNLPRQAMIQDPQPG